MSKSEKMYKNSPTTKRGGDGKMGIHKPSEADKEDMGLSGNPLPGTGGEMPIHEKSAEIHGRHQKEMKDMHGRHETEVKDMHKRHMKEAKTFGEESGQGLINKVEKDSKE